MKFLEDLNLAPDSKLVLIIAWKFKAAAQCEFSKDEFVRGMMEIGYIFRDCVKIHYNSAKLIFISKYTGPIL